MYTKSAVVGWFRPILHGLVRKLTMKPSHRLGQTMKPFGPIVFEAFKLAISARRIIE